MMYRSWTGLIAAITVFTSQPILSDTSCQAWLISLSFASSSIFRVQE
jgi:hypothetical protein